MEGPVSDHLKELQPLCEQLLVISPRLALLHTHATKDTWDDLLTKILRYNPARSISRIRWRRGDRGGKDFAIPRVERDQAKARATKARGLRRKALPPPGLVTVVFQGSAGRAPEELLAKLAKNISDLLGTPLQQAEGEELNQGEWAPLKDPRGRTKGGIRILLTSLAETERLQSILSQYSLEVDGVFRPLRTTSLFLEAAPLDRAWGAQRRRREGPRAQAD